MSTDQTIPDVAAAERILADAKAAETKRVSQELAGAALRERAYRHEWLTNYDRAKLRENVTAAERRVYEAFAETPAFAALAELQVARHVQRRSAEVAHLHKTWLAVQEGKTPPHDPMSVPVPDLEAHTLISALGHLVQERLEQWQQEQDDAWSGAVYGEGLSREEILEAERQAEEARRHEAAVVTATGSTDVTGMSDDERAKLGLPTGQARTDEQRRRGY